MPREVWLLGNAVSRSLSPAMQNAAFSALGIDCRYLPREIRPSELARTIAEIRSGNEVLGANVTIPFKEAVIPLLDELDEVSSRTGAVNTITRNGRQLIGSNTDVVGFRRALADCGYAFRGEDMVVFGAGGAARAVLQSVRQLVGHVWVVARRQPQAERLIADLGLARARPLPIDELAATMPAVGLVVNATPVDLPSVVRRRPGPQVFDLRYRRSAEGRAMLLHQGAASFQAWTGRAAPLDLMRAALAQALEAVPA
jgi:shikimate dehydrogenase